MRIRAFLLLAASAVALASAPGCVVHAVEPGAVMSDGSVYVGFNLFDAKGKADRERYDVGQELGAFRSVWLHADEPVAISKATIVFADGERYALPVPKKLSGSSQQWALPRGPRAIHSIVVVAKAQRKGLAKIEIYAAR